MLEKVTDHCFISADWSGFEVHLLIFGDPFFPHLELSSESIYDKDTAISWCRELESRLFLHEEDL